MFRLLICCGAVLLTACSPIMKDDVRTVARAAAEARFGLQCVSIDVPARAFLPVNITGGGRDDYMLSFARVLCEKNTTLWTGAAAPLFQLWTNEGGKPRMLLEENMQAFRHDLKSEYLVTDQTGANCFAGLGAQICRVVYRWDRPSHALKIVDRQFMPAQPLPGGGNISMWLQPSTQGKGSPTAATKIYRPLSISTDPHTNN